MGHYRPTPGSLSPGQALEPSTVPRQAVRKGSSEVDMSKSSINRHDHSHHTAVAGFWLFAGMVALVAFGDVVAVLALALAIVTLVLWAFREAEHRVQKDTVEVAPVTPLRPTSAGQSHLQNAPAQASWRAPRAA
jgi:hypothetical protein